MEVISTRRYEARPPADSHASILVDPTNAVATVKEEEWETRKKKEITTTRQIETRVKRQVVLEDGEVVVDSGPQVTTNTTEDVEQQEHTTQERRTTGDEPQKIDWPSAAKAGALVQKELNETIVKSREEIEERLETEDRQQLGDITDEAYLQAVRNNRGDLRVALAESKRQLSSQQQQQGPRVVQHTTRSNKVVDTEKTLERSELKQDGQIVTERKTTVEHEEIKDDEAPEEIDGVPRDEVDEAHEVRKEATQRYVKRRDEDIVDYVSNGGERVAREMRYVSETTEAERTGDWPNEPMPGLRSGRIHTGKHGFTTETHHQNNATTTTTSAAAAAAAAAARKDALTRKPLDLEEEDEARKFETSKWLESHFGSESRSSHGSLEDEEHHHHHHSTNTSYINVTMKSVPTAARERYKQTTTTTTTTKQQRRTTTNGATLPSGYFQGISEWSERYQSTEKQNNHIRSKSPQYIMDSTREVSRSNGHHHQPSSESLQRSGSGKQQQQSYTRNYEAASRRHQEQRHSPPHERPKAEPPSPPLRRKAKEQVITSKTERSYHQEAVPRAGSVERAASPVHVVQRTWESRSRDERDHHERRERTLRNGELHSSSRRHLHSPERTRHRPRSPASRSISPSPVRLSPARRDDKDKHSRPSKSPSPSKYKIGESFRKLVGKLRSASSERKNGKRPGSSSTSQVTQTDDGSYVQYNSVDRNIPLGPDYDTDDRPPERPPRSPRNNLTSTSTSHLINVRESPKMTHSSNKYRSSSSPRQHEYKETTIMTTRSGNDQPIHRYYLGEDPYGGSIYGKEKAFRETRVHSSRHRARPIDEVDYSMESSSLGRFSKSTGRLVNEQQIEYERAREIQTLPRKMHNQASSSSRTTTTTTRRIANGTSPSTGTRYVSTNNAINGNGYEQQPSRQYGSMINISFRNQVSPPKTTHYVHTSINTQPPKPEKTYKSTLSRSKSFNVEIADDGVVTTPKTRHINKLDETPPLKSPGILASISRNNNREKLFSNGRLHDH